VAVTKVTQLDARLSRILDLRDEIGVISVYVGIDPTVEASPRPRWKIELDAEVQRLRDGMRAELDRRHWIKLDRRLGSLAPLLDELVDPGGRGRGRALFALAGVEQIERLVAQTVFATEATFGDVPHVVPLLGADDGHPLGLVTVGRDRVRALEARLGEVVELGSFDVEPVVTDGPERKGPAARNPLRAQQVVAQRDRYQRHVETEHHHLLVDAAAQIAEGARARGWEVAVVAGDPRGADPVRDALVAAGTEAELVDRDLDEWTPARLLADLTPTLRSLRDRHDLALVLQARDAAASGGLGAVGLTDVLGILSEGRVARLLLDGTRPLETALGPNGEQVLAGMVDAGLVAWPARSDRLLADRVAIRAFETGARVSVVSGEAAAALTDSDGVAAVLRW
jgi:hypothetical protein